LVKKHLNPPLLREMMSSLFNTPEKINNYVIENPSHRIETTYYLRTDTIITQHIYDDNVLIHQVWKLKDSYIQNVYSEVGIITKMEQLLHLVDIGWMHLHYSAVWKFSEGRENEKEWQTESREIIKGSLAYKKPEPTILPDFLFDILLSDVTNHLQFDQYIEEKRK
jgi:hypothetical protein